MALFVYAESDYRIHFETAGLPPGLCAFRHIRFSFVRLICSRHNRELFLRHSLAYRWLSERSSQKGAAPIADLYAGQITEVVKHGTDTGDKPDIFIRRKCG